MNCILCQQTIENYSGEMHRLKLDDHREVDICDACCRTFVNWQGEKLAKLFPTRTLKKMHPRNR